MNKLNLPDNLIRLRHEKKLTQEELADFLGVTKASVSKWEKGQNTPDLLLLPQLAAFFDVTVDALIGYEAQLSAEQIRCTYAKLCRDFASLPFAEAVEKTKALAHQYYACYPFLLQLGVLYWNHYMLAETEKEGRQLLQDAVHWCERIMQNCSDVGVCSDAFALKAGLNLQLGKAAEVVEALEPAADPCRMAGQNGSFLMQAYRMAGETEKAKSYVQVKYYIDLVNLVGDAMQFLSLHEADEGRCRETVRRVRGILELYQLEELHPNLSAQFYYLSAATFAAGGMEEEALEALRHFEQCADQLLQAEEVKIHGDRYFDLLDAWIERLPLGSMAPRDKSFIRQSLWESLSRPVFDSIRDSREFQRLVQRCKNNRRRGT
ncbi:MAG: helix-turn-helix domain-containing protein [Eubacterium sp.]|nr:helix-turn-helix domain-containing protein [Eubacterium sp.]